MGTRIKMNSDIKDRTQELKDLTILQEELNRLRSSAFHAVKDALRMSPEELRHSGHKTNEAAAIGFYKYYAKEIEKLTVAHLKKYPD
jgi:hypothetical protein